MNIKEIIKEEYTHFFFQRYKILLKEEFDYDNYNESFRNVMGELFWDFLYENNENFTKRINWINLPFNLLKNVWDSYMKYGYLPDNKLKALDKIERRLYRNILLIDILTFLSGHTSGDPDEDFHDYFDYIINSYIRYKIYRDQYQIDFDKGSGQGIKPTQPSNNILVVFKFFDKLLEEEGINDLDYIRENQTKIKNALFETLKERFYDYYSIDKKGQDILSDYGLDPLKDLLIELQDEENPDKKIPILDRILNVAHMRSDLAAWLVDGGTHALDNLSGYGEIGTEGGLTKDDLIKMRDNIK